MTLLQQIINNISYLPEKDKKIAQRYLESRDFESILEIVESVFSKTDSTEDSDLNMSNLYELRSQLIQYLRYLGIPNDGENEDFDSINEYQALDYDPEDE